MSLPHFEPPLPTDSIRITPWADAVIDMVGHDPRSGYVERFWLPLLGPSTTLLLRRIATEFDRHPEGFDLGVDDTAGAMGLGKRKGPSSPFLRSLARTGQFHLSQTLGAGELHVRRKLPPLTRHQVVRLPAPLRDEHDSWQQASHAAPDLAQRRRRARRLALSLLELGEPDEAVEQQLHRWKIHPALAHEALRWAHMRRGTPPPAGVATTDGPTAPPAPLPAPRTAPPIAHTPEGAGLDASATSVPSGDAA